MKKRNALLSLLLVFVLATSIFVAGCGTKTDTNADTSVNSEDNATTNDSSNEGEEDVSDSGDSSELADLYSHLDLSEPYTVTTYVVGDRPEDTDLVVEEINKILESEFNTTMDLKHIAWADIATKYSLILAGGEDVDLMFTAPWNYYYTEAAKGAFMEITEEFIEKAMPQTKATQAPESWQSAAINGKVYAVPKNSLAPEHKFVAIRDDLREKYGLEPLTDWDSLENYLVTIAEKETPESGIWGLAAAGGNHELRIVWNQRFDIMHDKMGTGPFGYLYNNGEVPTLDDFFVYWDSEYFRDFAKRMKYLREKGVWSQDALTNTVSDDDAFANGQGACIAWNGTVYQYGKLAEENLGVTVAYYDITPDSVVMVENYNNNMFAIAAASKNPERAGMVLDLLKNDTRLYRLFVAGIEGKHYINIDDKYHKKGPDAEKFPWDSFGWGIRRDDLEEDPSNADPRETTLNKTFEERMTVPPTNGFVFDEEPVKNEIAAINAVIDEYLGMLELGMVDDVDATIDEMMSRIEASGLDIVWEEFKKQYNTWLDSLE